MTAIIPPETEDGWQRHDDDNPFMILNGPIWYREEGGLLHVGFRSVHEVHGNSLGYIHGGMLAAFADFALGHKVWFAHDRKPIVTAHLDINYVSGGLAGEWIHCTPEIVRKTRSLCFVRGDIMAAGRVVATASGVWKSIERGGDRRPPT